MEKSMKNQQIKMVGLLLRLDCQNHLPLLKSPLREIRSIKHFLKNLIFTLKNQFHSKLETQNYSLTVILEFI